MTNIFNSKFCSANDVVVPRRWCLKVGVADIGCKRAAYRNTILMVAYRNTILMLSLETTLAYVDPSASEVLCLSKTHWTLQVKSIFTSHTRWPMTLCQPLGAGWPSARISNATPTLYISFTNAFIQKSFPFFQSSSLACSTLVGISIPYLCFVCCIWVFKAATMAFLLLRVCPTHQIKAGSSSMPLDTAYLVISIRYALSSLTVSSTFHSCPSIGPKPIIQWWSCAGATIHDGYTPTCLPLKLQEHG